MEPVFILWTVLGTVFVLGNLLGVGIFHYTEGDEINMKTNTFSFWFLTTMFFLLFGWAYAIIQLGGRVIKAIKNKQNREK